jgi:hypothetical protein
VVDSLVPGQRPPKDLLHDESMFAHRASVPSYVAVAKSVGIAGNPLASAVELVAAGSTAKDPDLSLPGKPVSGKGSATVQTGKETCRAQGCAAPLATKESRLRSSSFPWPEYAPTGSAPLGATNAFAHRWLSSSDSRAHAIAGGTT